MIMNIPIAANVLGTTGAVCWSIQLLPQIFINYRRHHTTGLQPSMMLLWASAGVPLGVYNIVEEFNIALRVQAQILTALSLITWAQCYYYSKGWRLAKCIGVVLCLGTFMGGLEAGLVFALQVALARGTAWPATLMAVLAATLLALGVLRHYWDIWQHRTVRGISFIFVAIDAAGDLFSLLSIRKPHTCSFTKSHLTISQAFQNDLDVLGMTIYGTELVLWIGVMICGGYYNLAPWIRRKVSSRRHQAEGERTSYGVSTDVALHDLPSSTSVFRTPSSMRVERTIQR